MRPISTLRVSAVVAALLLAGSLQACSDDNGGSDSYVVNPDLTKSEIVIGMANASTGSADGVQNAPSEDVAKAWEQWVNTDMGGINGHPVKVVVRDTKEDPATAVDVANQLINTDKVIAEVGGSDSVSAGAWIPIFNSAKVPVIGGQIVDDHVIAENPYHYSLVIPVSSIAAMMVDTAQAAGAKSFTAVLCAESPSCAGAAPVWEARSAELGIKYDGYTSVKASDPSFTAACLNVAKSGADFVELATSAATSLRVVNDCNKQGFVANLYGVTYGAFDGARLVPVSEKGANFLGIMEGFPWWLENPAAQQYRDVMTKYGKEGTYTQNPTQSDAWAALELFRKAMKNASDNPTADEVVQALAQIKDDDLGGLLPQKVTFGLPGTERAPIECLWRAELIDGKTTETVVQCVDS
ncbi:MAG: hypothetical protein EOP24_38335 [Hyphomicrobiales bacterium]|nr:MAG: hypothetical protein EOP24_38335 [Hyphomicrobiales bacterium]